MRRPAQTLLLAGIAAFAEPAAVLHRLPHHRGVRVEPCTFPRVDGRVSCGTIEVPERRGSSSGKTVELRFVILHAAAATPTGVVAVLPGGPGSSVTTAADIWSFVLAG